MSMRAYLGTGADAFVAFLRSASLPDAAITRFLDGPLEARQDATPARGSFPIIALAQGNGQTAADQAVLGEFMASHGYLVVTTASPMIATPMTAEEQVPRFAEQQADDLGRGMDSVSRWPSARSTVRFAIGHSFGARPALLLAMRDPRIRGVVSLDGGIGSATARAPFMTAKSFNAAKATAPVLHFYEELDAFMTPDMTLLKSLSGVVTLTLLPGMRHSHFTTFGFGAAVIPEMAKVTQAGPEIRDSLMQMARETLAFLERHGR
jgi:dienelactone hydrolase